MSSVLPNTPYFRNLPRLVFDDIIDLGYTTDGLGRNDKGDFTKPSSSRNRRVLVQGESFYVSIDEISTASPALAALLSADEASLPVDVSPDDFTVLLRHICPSGQQEVTAEAVHPLLSLATKWGIEGVIEECGRFICSPQVKKLPVVALIEVYQLLEEEDEEEDEDGKVTHPMRRNILKILLELEDHAELFSLMLTGASFSCFPVLKAALKSIKEVQHTISFANCSSPLLCRCVLHDNRGKRLFERKASRAASPSLCGLYCSECSANCCVDCQKEMCPVKLDALLENHLAAQKKAAEDKQEEASSSQKVTPLLEEDTTLEDYPEKNPCSIESSEEREEIQKPAIHPRCEPRSISSQCSTASYTKQYCPSSYSQPQYYQLPVALSPRYCSPQVHYSTPYPSQYSPVVYYPQSCYPPSVYQSYTVSPTMSCAFDYPQMTPPQPYQYVTQYIQYM